MAGLPCRFCGGATRVVKSQPYANQVWRRRECLTCQKRFTTRERFDKIKKMGTNAHAPSL
jgi:transcriptional regulator NrdR family protein